MKNWVGVVLILAACGPSTTDKKNGDPVVINNSQTTGNNGQNNPTGNNASNNVPDPSSRAGQVRAGLAIPDAAYDAGVGSLTLGSEAVFLASQLAAGGQELVTTGTLTQQGQTEQFEYSASPNDRLRIAWSDGAPTDFVVTAFDGDFTGSASGFVNNDHIVEMQVSRENLVDIQLSSQRQNGQSSATLGGTLTEAGVTYTLNLQLGGTYSSQVEITSAEHESSEQFVGTISGSDGFEASVNETHFFKLLQFENLVTNRDRTSNNTWTVDGAAYALDGVRIRYETKNGWANPSDYWIVEGAVLEEGAVIGQVAYEVNELLIELFIEVDGERIELETFQREQ